MTFTTSDSVPLFFQTFGDKDNPAILLIHGLGADGRMWEPQIKSWPEQGYYLIVPDMRGHGSSEPVENFRIEDCARDMAELVEHLGLESVAVAGVSMGGVIAQQFACDYPDRVDMLILADTFSEVSSLNIRFAGWMQWLTIKIAPRLLRTSLGWVYGDFPDIAHYFQQTFDRMNHNQLLMARAALNRFYITPRLSNLNIPTLVLAGDLFGDWFIHINRRIADAIPNARFVILENAMDPSNLVNPESFSNEVLAFFDEHSEHLR